MVDVLCHMCGETGERAVEHHYPKWMRKILPIENTPSFNLATGVQWNKDVGVRTINEICKTCNSGWMAKLQDEARPVLGPKLKLTRYQKLSAKEEDLIARWYVMFTMVYENDSPQRVFHVPSDQRRRFCVDQIIPEDWNVWIGFTKQKLVGGRGASHLPGSFVLPNGEQEPYQITIAQFGGVILMSSSGVAPNIGEDQLRDWGMTRLFPPLGAPPDKIPLRFPRGFLPRILADVLWGTVTTPARADSPMGLHPHFQPPPAFFPN